MSNNEKVKSLFDGLNGFMEYNCIVKSKNSFENGDRVRGGILNIEMFKEWTGVHADISAIRVWARNGNGKYFLDTPLEWEAEGGVRFRNDELIFTYSALSEFYTGETRDRFLIDNNSFMLYPGNFIHTTSTGEIVSGIVHLVKLKKGTSPKWFPTENYSYNPLSVIKKFMTT